MDIELIVYQLWHLGLAFVLSLPLGWDREQEERSAGLRTFPLVALATCGLILMSRAYFQEGDALARIIYGAITGIGFIGGGAIIKKENKTSGTATAASLWCTGAIGIAVALDQFSIAITLCVMSFIMLQLKWIIKRLCGPVGSKKILPSDSSDSEIKNQEG